MPQAATKPEFPPVELTDREAGFGELGMIYGYPQYGDGSEWTGAVRLGEFQEEAPETSHGSWFRIEDQGQEEINNFQGTSYEI